VLELSAEVLNQGLSMSFLLVEANVQVPESSLDLFEAQLGHQEGNANTIHIEDHGCLQLECFSYHDWSRSWDPQSPLCFPVLPNVLGQVVSEQALGLDFATLMANSPDGEFQLLLVELAEI